MISRRAAVRYLVAAAVSVAALVVLPGALSADAYTIVVVAGTGARGLTTHGSQATETALDRPRSIFATAGGGFVWAEPFSNTVWKVGPDGIVAKVAGSGELGYGGDGGLATHAKFHQVHAAAPTTDGGFLLADTLNHRIRRVAVNGVITTVAGTGEEGYSGDGGPATSARIDAPRGVVALSDGGFLIPDTENNRVRRVWPDGTITTVAGTGVQGFAGDGGPATAAQLSFPFGVAATADGGFLVIDSGNDRIRRVSPDGTITTVAGNGTVGYSGDGGPAIAASLGKPPNIVAYPDSGFLIADSGNNRIRRVWPDGTITTIVGTGVQGFTGDRGPASAARLAVPTAVGLTASGQILIADTANNRIRYVGVPGKPANTRRPFLSGVPAIGERLQGYPGGWRGHGVRFVYAWQRCAERGHPCSPIPGARGTIYQVQPEDAGSTLRMKVAATTATGSASSQSGPTRRVPGVVTRSFPATSSAADGHVWRLESGGRATPVTAETKGSSVVVARTITEKGVLVSVGLLRFDIAAVPNDARVTRVALRFEITYGGSEDRLLLEVESYPTQRWPIDLRDFTTRPAKPRVGSYDLASLHGGYTGEIGLLSKVVQPRGQVTGLRLLIPGGTTNETNAVHFAAVDHRSLAPPKLVVTYSVP